MIKLIREKLSSSVAHYEPDSDGSDSGDDSTYEQSGDHDHSSEWSPALPGPWATKQWVF